MTVAMIAANSHVFLDSKPASSQRFQSKKFPMFDRRQLMMALTAVPFAGCATGPSKTAGPVLSLATLNIWHDRGDWPNRLPMIVDTLRAADADVIGLQEVLEDAATGLPNQAATIAQILGYRHVFVSTDVDGSPRRYGNAILTRLPIVEHDWEKLEPLDDYRTALRVRVKVGDRPVDIVNTHLHHTPEGGAIRDRQIARLFAWLGERDAPLVILGDLNAALTNPEMTLLQTPRFTSLLAGVHPDQAERSTLNTAYGHRSDQIDHILVETAYFTPLSASISGDVPVGETWPSDHFAVTGAARVKPK
ncbi:endonuclease/exonuclease/phosphatase family protein [Brevundimonas variabilis]|uniref:Endonuclease/exonuclease/phosphatase family metal-dependent hydrolase n=1 Tax=Brevundimonas variabilis TaxID=74312 RepID=A0A7W9CIH7_9CAUL|nr:endonuclease/exonuclease/phosphatase family protein [Brevundimonas variabilis]MBB5746273.1 endonuclease/exonuclease/phosphatase family metal-dependent hydrolase [Brevundimonas variabilis]